MKSNLDLFVKNNIGLSSHDDNGEEYFLFEKYFTEEDAVAVYAKKRK